MKLNQQQKKEIFSALESGNFNITTEVEKLISKGFSREDALAQIKVEYDAYRQHLFDQKLKSQDQDEYRNIAVTVVLLTGIAGPVFEITSLAWYVVAFMLAGGAGYWAYKDKPIAAVTAAVGFVVVFPITYFWYISGRSSILRIEMIIPAGLAMVASFLLWLLISKIFYTNK